MNPSPIHFTIVYGVTLFLAFFLFIPASISNHRMHGKCLLSATGKWNVTQLIVTWGRSSDCNFVLVIGIASLIASLYFLIRSIIFVRKGYEGCWKVGLGNFDKAYGVDTDDFSTHVEVSEFGSWSSSLAWLAATVLSFFKVRYYHKNEELLRNLAFEKDSLIPYRTQYQKIDERENSVG